MTRPPSARLRAAVLLAATAFTCGLAASSAQAQPTARPTEQDLAAHIAAGRTGQPVADSGSASGSACNSGSGAGSGNGSGDIFIAFSTANESANQVGMTSLTALGNEQMDALFLATAQAVEESIISAMIAAEPMTGRDGNKAAAIDHKALLKLLKGHKALVDRKPAR